MSRISKSASPTSTNWEARSADSDQIWINTRTGKSWKPASRHQRKIAQGEFMTGKEAVQKRVGPFFLKKTTQLKPSDSRRGLTENVLYYFDLESRFYAVLSKAAYVA
jgi:hypothetical protein